MEERNTSTRQTQIPNPTETTQSASAPTAPAPAAVAAEAGQQKVKSKKRNLENGEFRHSKYFKIRTIVKELRPSFLEVIHAPAFRDCKAVHDIQKQMKILIDLSKQLGIETVSMGKPINPPKEQSLPGEFKEIFPDKHTRGEKQVGQSQLDKIQNMSNIIMEKDLQSDRISNELAQGPDKEPDKVVTEAKNLEKQLQELQGTYVVGGSPMGWNFLVYAGSDPVFYGVTREAALLHRASKNQNNPEL